MGQNPRRSAFRLRWGEASESSAAEEQAPAGQMPDAAAPDAGGAQSEAQQAVSPAGEVRSTDGATAAGTAAPESAQLLREMVDAMRRVAESSRDTGLAELRTGLEERLEQLRAAAAERADDLRRRTELDINGIGDWERSETERIRGEAEQRREARRGQLERELAEHQTATDASVEEARRRLADHEHELTSFFAELAAIEDPAAFVMAVKRMPSPPELGGPPTARAAAAPAPPAAAPAPPAASASAAPAAATNGSEAPDAERPAGETGEATLAERLAQLDERLGTAAAEPAVEGHQPGDQAAAVTPRAEGQAEHATNGETSTPIVVKGLGSFGAITSFKQALERVDGIKGVTLSLGPTGEFVYRASHSSAFDIVGAIRTIEGPGAGIEESDGSVLVTIERGR